VGVETSKPHVRRERATGETDMWFARRLRNKIVHRRNGAAIERIRPALSPQFNQRRLGSRFVDRRRAAIAVRARLPDCLSL
jgi:hypothetical protein